MTDRFSDHSGSCILGSVLSVIIAEHIKVPLFPNKTIHTDLVSPGCRWFSVRQIDQGWFYTHIDYALSVFNRIGYKNCLLVSIGINFRTLISYGNYVYLRGSHYERRSLVFVPYEAMTDYCLVCNFDKISEVNIYQTDLKGVWALFERESFIGIRDEHYVMPHT